MQIVSLALITAIAFARRSSNLLDFGGFPDTMYKMDEHFGNFGGFGNLNNRNKHDDDGFDKLDNPDFGFGSKDLWDPFKRTRQDMSFDSRVPKTSSNIRRLRDGTTVVTLVKKMGDKETTDVITIKIDGTWGQKTITKFVQTRIQQNDPSEYYHEKIIVPSKPRRPRKTEMIKPKDTIITPPEDETVIKHTPGKLMMGVKERDAFEEQNRIRTDPRSIIKKVENEINLFDSTGRIIERPGVNLRTNEGIGAWYEAIDALRNQGRVLPLEWNDYLALAAEDHCNDQGHRGTLGHNGSNGSRPWDRINRYGRWGGTVSENLAYGQSSGAEYIIQLYIDDGVTDRGHRINMINPELKLTGMAYCNHRTFGGMIAVAYAKSFVPNQHGKSEVIRRAKN